MHVNTDEEWAVVVLCNKRKNPWSRYVYGEVFQLGFALGSEKYPTSNQLEIQPTLSHLSLNSSMVRAPHCRSEGFSSPVCMHGNMIITILVYPLSENILLLWLQLYAWRISCTNTIIISRLYRKCGMTELIMKICKVILKGVKPAQ